MTRFACVTFLLPALALAACHSAPPAGAPPAAGSAAPATAEAAAPLPAPLAAASDRVAGLLAQSNDDALKAAFSPDFMAAKGDDLRKIFSEASAEVGACGKPSAVKVKSETNGKIRIECAKYNVELIIEAQPAAPYLMEGLLIHVVKR